MFYVLGAPGSDKTTITSLLGLILPEWIIVDWDELMEPAGVLLGRSVRDHPETWQPYAGIMERLVKMLQPHPVLLLSGQSPDEMTGWGPGAWILLDCSDPERRRRLCVRGVTEGDIVDAIQDAAAYRALGLFSIDTTHEEPFRVAEGVAAQVRGHNVADDRGQG